MRDGKHKPLSLDTHKYRTTFTSTTKIVLRFSKAELAKAELDRKWSIEIDQAYQLCEVLQQELDILCNSLEELRGRVDSGSKENDRKGKGEHKVANLSPK